MNSRFLPWALVVMMAAPLASPAEELDPSSHRRAFVTSTEYDGNLGGLSGANTKCQSHATSAGLSNPLAFVAWLSDSNTDAYCHVHGLTGKKIDNCGQPSLPVARGPWVRMDGFPFAGTIDEMLEPTNRIVAHVMFDEYGTTLGDWEYIWTATDPDGEHAVGHPGDCTSWSSNIDSGVNAAIGTVWASTSRWTSTGGAACDSSNHLLCLDTGPALPLPHHTAGGALAFVSTYQGNANVGGLSGADAICLIEATAAGLPAPASFVAWLSTSSVHAIDRLTYDGPWIRVDGVKIAESKTDLTDGYLLAPLNVSAGHEFVGPYGVWTGTGLSGLASGGNCGDWGTATGTATSGTAPYANLYWTAKSTTSQCSYSGGRLYCFSNLSTVIFRDDFESADIDGWAP